MLRTFFEREGYDVNWCRSAADGLGEAVKRRPDVFVLDLDLPDSDGFSLIRTLREWNHQPIVVLSQRSGTPDKVRALDQGANDYMTKPFAPEELAARLRVLQRSDEPTLDGPILKSGPLCIDMSTQIATINGFSLALTPIENVILQSLARHAGKWVPRQRLISILWGTDAGDKIHDLHGHVARLRHKLEERGGHNLIRRDGNSHFCLSLVSDREEVSLLC